MTDASNAPRVALVEDDADSALLAVASLTPHYQVDTFTRGEDALAAFKRTIPVAVVLDIGLRRGMDGVQLLRTIREDARMDAVPTLALTAYASESMREKFMALGFDAYLAKPLREPEQLLDAVNALIKNGRRQD